MVVFPPPGPTSLSRVLRAYVFQQYTDDDGVQALNASFNQVAQSYMDWFSQVNLPIYTQPQIAGPLLDWVAEGIYGISRPALASGTVFGVGLLNTYELNTFLLNTFVTTSSFQSFVVSDDVFKRIITWFFFKGDGFQFSMTWLKRRVMRFLTDPAGSAPNIDNTYPVSVAFGASNDVTITITLTASAGITPTIATIFQAAVQSAAINLPFQFVWTVVVINDIGATNLTDDGGVLALVSVPGSGYPTAPTTGGGHGGARTPLPAGSVWSNGGAVSVIPGITPNPLTPPVFYGAVTAAQLLLSGGGNLPLMNPGIGTMQLWNNGGEVAIA